MKKAVKILLAILMVACLSLTVMACNKECKPGEHQWKDVRTIKVASCKEEGSKEVECEKCGKTETQPIEKLPHTPTDVAKEDATCGEAGHEAGTKCSVCGETISGMEIIDPTGVHTFVYPEGNDHYNETQHWKVCSVCGAADTKADHIFDNHLTCECGATDINSAVARIGAVMYGDLATAVTEATAGAEIVLMKNVTLDAQIRISKAITINLNNKTITQGNIARSGSSTDADAVMALFYVENAGNLTIKGTGSVNVPNTDNDNSTFIYALFVGGTAKIEGGDFTASHTVAFVEGKESLVGTLTITGGKFQVTHENTNYVLNKRDNSGAVISVSGGTFINYDPSHSNSENPEDNFVVDGAGIKMTEADGVRTYVICTDHQYVASVCSICGKELTDDEVITALKALEIGATMPGTYKLTGVIKSADDYSTQFKNRTIVITVKDFDVECYRVTNNGSVIDIATLGIGDTITVTGTLKDYSGKKEFDAGCQVTQVGARAQSDVTVNEVTNATVTGVESKAYDNGTTLTITVTPNTGYKIGYVQVNGSNIDEADGVYTVLVNKSTKIEILILGENEAVPVIAKLELSKDNRTSYDKTSKQVYTQNGITFTNNKSSSTTDIGDYGSPARCYKNSNIVIECASMTVITFNCNSASYATELEKSINAGCTSNGTAITPTVTKNGAVIVVTFAETVNEFTITALANQVRIDSIQVTSTPAE